MIYLYSFGGKIGKICWQNTWNELWGYAGFWDKNPGEKGRLLFGELDLKTVKELETEWEEQL